MQNIRVKILKQLQDKFNIYFENVELLDIALTHSSYANQNKNFKFNERLEFLGDAVLEIVISEYLFKKYENKDEGELTKLRAQIVCENSLFNIAQVYDLGKYINMSKGEEITGGRTRTSILSDCVEAIIAAIYLDKGYNVVKEFIINIFNNNINNAINDNVFFDYKTKLQEIIQKDGDSNIEYSLIKFEGPPHKRIFFVDVFVNSNKLGTGCGMSKKEAEQNAAHDALKKVDNSNE